MGSINFALDNITNDLTPICSCDSYTFIKKVGRHINTVDEESTQIQKPSKTYQNNIENVVSISLPNIHSINFVNDNYYNRNPNILEDDILSNNLDKVCSGESLVKYYNFEPSESHTVQDKCIAFWKTIMEQKDLKPVECRFKIHDFDFFSDFEKETQKTKENNSTNDLSYTTEDTEEYFWYNTLLEMKKKKMDTLALVTIGPTPTCKFCKPEITENNFDRYDYSKDVLCLNKWEPKSIHKPQKRQLAAAYGSNKRTKNSFESNIETDSTFTQKVEPIIVSTGVKFTEKTNTEKQNKFEDAIIDTKKLIPSKKNKKVILPEDQIHTATLIAQNYTKISNTNITESGTVKCDVCEIEQCFCEKYFEEEGKKFIDEVRNELRCIQKDKSCATNPQNPDFLYCSVCEVTERCANMHKELKIFNIPPKKEDVYLETIFKSKPHEPVYSTTILPQVKTSKKSTTFSMAVKPPPEPRRVTATKIKLKPIKKQEEPKLVNSTLTIIDQKNSIEPSKATTIKQSLLWYSSEVSNDI